MKILHLCPKTIYLKHQRNFANHHGLDVANDMILLISTINQHSQAAFEAETGVLPLPFILSSEPVGDGIAQHLSEHGVTATHKSFEVAAAVAKTHQGFNFSQF